MSRPSRARGLKHIDNTVTITADDVAPFTGAWIETPLTPTAISPPPTSRPSRARGLKHP